MEEENEQKKGSDLYFTGPHTWMAVKLVLQALQRKERGSNEEPKNVQKERSG